jgi:hypothetical protein
VGIFVVKIAVQAAVKVTPAMRANLLPAHSTLKFDFSCTGVADPHGAIIYPFETEINKKVRLSA